MYTVLQYILTCLDQCTVGIGYPCTVQESSNLSPSVRFKVLSPIICALGGTKYISFKLKYKQTLINISVHLTNILYT